MAGHMHHVAGDGHSSFQLLRGRHRQFRLVRHLHQVDIKVVGTWVIV